MKPQRQAGIDKKPVATAGTSRLPCAQAKPSARSENCDPSDVERIHADVAREIEKFDDPPQNEEETKHEDGAPKFQDSRRCTRFVKRHHEVNFSSDASALHRKWTS